LGVSVCYVGQCRRNSCDEANGANPAPHFHGGKFSTRAEKSHAQNSILLHRARDNAALIGLARTVQHENH
jgi:hypothetical protein